jgi:hypothetical protein
VQNGRKALLSVCLDDSFVVDVLESSQQPLFSYFRGKRELPVSAVICLFKTLKRRDMLALIDFALEK